MHDLLSMIRRALARFERLFEAAFGAANPFYHLGALTFFFFWVVIASGIYLYVFFETSLVGAFRSVEQLTHEQWYLGGVMRSLHRYASDALMLTMTLHLMRELVLGRFRGFRAFSWVTGVPLIWLVFFSGINGYWLVWDRLAQYIAIATTEWLDWLGIFGEPIARNFLHSGAVSDRFFTLLVFLHIGVPLFLLAFTYVHVARISRPKTSPPRALILGTSAALLALAFFRPALSQGPADLDSVTANVALDWFYLQLYPLLDRLGHGPVWAIVGGITLLFVVLPWLGRRQREAVAVVEPSNCNGCGRCFADCPFGAVVMRPHPDKPGHELAVVDPALCGACGICAGACPSSTPFRSIAELVTGIDMPQRSVHALRAELDAALAGLTGEAGVVVFGCDRAADVHQLRGPGVATVSLMCAAQLPPSFVDYALRDGRADGVLVSGCRAGDCWFRFGDAWIEQRFHSMREPHLRTHAARARVRVAWAGATDLAALRAELARYRESLRRLVSASVTEPQPGAPPVIKWRRVIGQIVFYGLFVAFVGYFSASPAYVHMAPGQALIKLSFSHPGQPLAPCRERSAAELARLAPNMRIARDCARERAPVAVEFDLDGQVHYRELLLPTGLKRDGASTLYRRFSVPAGTHRIGVRLKDHPELPGYNYIRQAGVTLAPGQVFVIDFNVRQSGFIFR